MVTNVKGVAEKCNDVAHNVLIAFSESGSLYVRQSNSVGLGNTGQRLVREV